MSTIRPAFDPRRPMATLAVLLLVAACSGSAGAASPTSATIASPTTSSSSGGGRYGGGDAGSSASPAASPSESPSSASGGEAYEVRTATGADGTFLTGEDGRTLYTFKKDTAPNASTCDGGCANAWPPFTIADDDTLKAGDGVTGNLATFDRGDGSKQVSYDGAPLYYFGGDKAAGDTNGQGLNGVWFVAAP